MIFKNIAEYEDTDSDLAKYTISKLHSEIERLKERLSEEIEEELKQSEILVKKQQEIERLKKELNKYKYRPSSKINFEKLMTSRKEIERLNKKSEILEENNKLLIQQKSQLYEDLDMLSERIDKAIEYLEQKSKEPEWWDTDFMMVISILKGDSNE